MIEQINKTIDPDRLDSEAAKANIDGTLRGALVNLNDDGRDDLLVEGDTGANITGFWIFRKKGRNWDLVLHTRALGLSIKRRRTRGFHDVEVVAATAVTILGATYKYDGERYRPGGCYEQDIGVGKDGEPGKKRYNECPGGDVKPYR